MQKGLFYLFVVLCFFTSSCKKKTTEVVTDYTYSGTTHAFSEQVYILSSGTNTLAWDSVYPDKIYVHYDLDSNTVSFRVTPQTHSCQTFQEEFTFRKNDLGSYTATSSLITASHTFELGKDVLTGYMLHYEGVDSNHTNYTLSFDGKLVQ